MHCNVCQIVKFDTHCNAKTLKRKQIAHNRLSKYHSKNCHMTRDMSVYSQFYNHHNRYHSNLGYTCLSNYTSNHIDNSSRFGFRVLG